DGGDLAQPDLAVDPQWDGARGRHRYRPCAGDEDPRRGAGEDPRRGRRGDLGGGSAGGDAPGLRGGGPRRGLPRLPHRNSLRAAAVIAAIDDMPAGAIGFRVSGELTDADYADALAP